MKYLKYFIGSLALGVFGILLLQFPKCSKSSRQISTLDDLTLNVEGTNLEIQIKRNEDILLNGVLGLSLPPELSEPSSCSDSPICWSWGNAAKITIDKSSDNVCFDISWNVKDITKARDCFNIGSHIWYGGMEEHDQYFPLNKSSIRKTIPLLPGDMLQDKDFFLGGVAEPWWINSKGIGIWVPEGIPLFFSWNENQDDNLCLISQYEKPYVRSDPENLKLTYKICEQSDPKSIQIYGAKNLLGLPTGVPDARMMVDPIWSTWAQFKVDINQSIVLAFANEILSRGFNNSQIEIDDNWETCYGEAEFDPIKFPDPEGMVTLLKQLGFRVTVWIHPFVNLECPTFNDVALGLNKGYFVQDTKQIRLNERLPGFTYWWQGDLAGYVDFTNPKAVDWWRARLDKLKTEVGIDSFKFDAGEANWLPSTIRLSNGENPEFWPAIYTTKYAESMAYFGGQIEVRVGRRSQEHPIFVRMLDKFSRWGYNNGLKTMITTLLQMSIAGYPFILPDMIGGNGYAGRPEKELYIRWLQSNVFMPSMQFSYVPWIYDQEVVEHSLNMTALRSSYSNVILDLANEATKNGEPINRPIWWVDPLDQTALSIDSEYLLGNDLLVAPVLDESAISRDIYLPVGNWRDESNPDKPVYQGPIWIRDYPAPLYTLPYFTRV